MARVARHPQRRPLRRALLAWLAPAIATSSISASHAADPQSYTVDIGKTGDKTIDGAVAGTSSLVSLRKTAPAGPFALVGRARNDADQLRTVLGGFGYYDAHVAITIDGTDVADPALPNQVAAIPKGRAARIEVTVDRGPLFHLRNVTLQGNVPLGARESFHLHRGQPAVAADVLAAGSDLRDQLEESGHAFATVGEPTATEDPAAHAIDVVFPVDAGPRVDIGDITLMGLHTVHPRFIRRRLTVHPGQLYQPSRIDAARQDLASSGVFATVQATVGKTLDAQGRVPVTFSFVEAPPRTVALTAAYSTDLGGSAGVTWTHDNFFGNEEKLELAAIATGLGGTAQQGLGYDVYAQLTKPDLWARNQNGVVRIEALKQNLYTYNQQAYLLKFGLDRRLSKRWNVAADVVLEQEQIIQEGTTRNYTLGQLPLTANYDSTDLASPLDAPTHGVRVGLGITPSYSLGNGSNGPGTSAANSFFTILQGQASTYLDFAHLGLTRPGRTVIAVHGVVASVQGASTFQLPPDQRLYAGGSTTVRGYRYQQISPLFPDNRPEGGTSLDAIQVEYRQRIVGNIGAVLFGDAGQVGATSAPFNGPLRVGAGVGARYYTPIGPIRLDVAIPLNKVQGDDSFELYIGLGETF